MAAILVFFCLLAIWPLLPRSRKNILLNFEFKNEATRTNLQENKRILKVQVSLFTLIHIILIYKNRKEKNKGKLAYIDPLQALCINGA